MKFKPGDKVWVLRTHHPGAPVPPGSECAGVVVAVWQRRRLGQTYLVDVPGVSNHRGSCEWVVYEQRMRPRDDDEQDKFGSVEPNRKVSWNYCPWVPPEVRYAYTKFRTP